MDTFKLKSTSFSLIFIILVNDPQFLIENLFLAQCNKNFLKKFNGKLHDIL